MKHKYNKRVVDRGIYVDAGELSETIEKYQALGYGVEVECKYHTSGTVGPLRRYSLTIVKPVKDRS